MKKPVGKKGKGVKKEYNEEEVKPKKAPITKAASKKRKASATPDDAESEQSATKKSGKIQGIHRDWAGHEDEESE